MTIINAKKLNVSKGNKKLVKNENTDFIIWNLPTIVTCPYRTEACEHACYARKAERVYPQVLPSRMVNLEESKKNAFVADMIYTIMSIASRSKKQEIIVRIHESGDFYNQEYTSKWLAIMNACKDDSRIRFIAYTKSFKYFDGIVLPENFSLRASIWNDTSEKQLAIVRRNNWNIYTAVPKFTENDTFTQCRCKDCATCGKCWSADKDIRCEIH